ncbi:DUF3304 domain-containing protein [Cupriavidus sp. USMAA2-4]|uniref:DUF3304 domain-containing protein n=1 Tax=Cupriavidus sp. USMAA2-4 TaxID=876364 RepID=UPI000ABF961A
MKVKIRWLVEKIPDGVTYGSWYQAEAELPPYGRATYGLWAIFLPGDRVKVMVRGSVEAGYTNVWTRPSDDDPYVVVGTLDEAANREAEARHEAERKKAEAYAVEVANREKTLLRQQENER